MSNCCVSGLIRAACYAIRWITAEIATAVGSKNRRLNVLVQWQFVFEQSSSSCCSYFDITRPRRHLTIDQQWLAIARLHMGCFQRGVATELQVSESVITQRHRRGRPLARSHADGCLIVSSGLGAFFCCVIPITVCFCCNKLFEMKKLQLHAST